MNAKTRRRVSATFHLACAKERGAKGADAELRCVSGTAGGCHSNCHDVVESMLLDCKRTDPINGLALTRILAADKCALLTADHAMLAGAHAQCH